MRKIAAHGHLVANHTMNHHDLCQNPAEQAAEIDASTELIAQTTGVRPLLFRSPYGAFCQSLEAALTARGLPDIGWNIDPQDWKTDDEEAVFAYLTNKVDKLQGARDHAAARHPRGVGARAAAVPRLAGARERARRAPAPPAGQHHRLPRDGPEAPGDARAALPELVGALVADARGSVARHLP